MSLLIFKLEAISHKKIEENPLIYKSWKPSLKALIPPGLPRKYIIWWFFHYFRIFRNNDYTATLVYDKNILIHSFCIIPAYFRWPFMKKNDLQVTYIKTHPDFRGKGIAALVLVNVLSKIETTNKDIWYVTDLTNKPSINLAKKVGFKFYSNAKRRFIFNLPCLKQVIARK